MSYQCMCQLIKSDNGTNFCNSVLFLIDCSFFEDICNCWAVILEVDSVSELSK